MKTYSTGRAVRLSRFSKPAGTRSRKLGQGRSGKPLDVQKLALASTYARVTSSHWEVR